MKDQGTIRGTLVVPLLAGAAVLGLTLFGLINLTGRTGLRKAHEARRIVGVDSYEVRGSTDIRFVLSRKRIGDPVEIRFGPDDGPPVVRDTVIPYYSQQTFPLALVLMGGFSFLAGFVVLLFRPGDRRARIFYWLSLSFGATVIVGGGTYGVHGRLANLLPGVLFNIAYPMTLALLLWFARSYAPARPRSRPVLFWSVPALWGVLLSSTFLVSQLGPSIGAYRLREVFKHVFRFYVIIVGIAALVEFARALRSTDSEEDRAQIKWYLIGLAAGLGPFLAFNQLPLVVMDRPLLSESFALVFFLLIPVFMVISILQFRLLRVNIVFHRGLVYSILTVFTLGVFLLAVEGLRRVFPRATATGNVVITLGAAVFIAVLLSPGRRAIQDFVDQLFFRQAYDYRRAVRTFRAAAPGIIDADDLIALHAGTMRRALPTSTVGLLVHGPRRLVGLDEGAAAKLGVLALDAGRTWARAARVRTFEDLDFSREDVLESAGAEIVLALPRGAGTPPGLLVFGRKLSGHRFTKEDIGLIETLGGELAVNLGRIRIQEQMIYERASREKTEELVRLKTEFISSVAHELRTPITSLDGLSGLLRSGKVGDPDKRQRLLGLLAGECGRLTRFLTNVLDYGQIEGEAKVYAPRPTDLGPILREVADLVRESQTGGEAVIRVDVPGAAVTVLADADAVRQAVLNLLDNALKYSPERKEVTLSLTAGPEAAVIAVKDRGMGIGPEDLERIFEAFFRSPGAVAHDPSGVGLGLRIVRHIMDAHGGRVVVESEPGKGSVFRLVFPQEGVKP
ncbi:MAG: ATP-binding protein [Candidatus Aminicenantes bacterium]|nr:ATP-binding protein [Candidatus Aminicenantes bacterium]